MQPGVAEGKLHQQRSAARSPNGDWGGAPAEIEFLHFYPKNLTCSGNDPHDFPDNQLAKFRTV